MLFNPLDGVLGSVAKIRILRALLPLTTPVSGREAQKLARVRSRNGVSKALDDLSQLGVLRRTETQGAQLYELNREHELVPQLTRLFSEEQGGLKSLVSAVTKQLSKHDLSDHLRSLILYGSNARWDAGPESDVDLLALVDSESWAAPVQDLLYEAGRDLTRKQGLRLSPYVLSVARVRERAADHDPFIAAVQNEGRLLMGASLAEIID
ncbi:MAG TPA: nucleotidyltransferase domain-containing protein [Longimicrobiaceae bacterium]|nr:nucleotidyltransferase domain-containing protein [Longimicrobiaceae bacterium]